MYDHWLSLSVRIRALCRDSDCEGSKLLPISGFQKQPRLVPPSRILTESLQQKVYAVAIHSVHRSHVAVLVA